MTRRESLVKVITVVRHSNARELAAMLGYRPLLHPHTCAGTVGGLLTVKRIEKWLKH
jgi:hypothetical protein